MSKEAESGKWVTSSKMEKELTIDGCRLMNLRVEDRLGFKNQNAFLYLKADVDRLKEELPKDSSGAGGIVARTRMLLAKTRRSVSVS